MTEALANADKVEAEAEKRVRRVKTPETLDEAQARILGLKLTDAEIATVKRVFDLWRNGQLVLPKGRLSKRSVFAAWTAWLESERERKKRKVLESRKPNCWIVTDLAQLEKLYELLRHEDEVALDTETTGVDIFNDRIVGIAGYFPKADVEFYVPYGHIDPSDKDAFVALGREHGFDRAIERYRRPGQLDKDTVLLFFATCVMSGLRTDWSNYKFDCHMAMNVGIEPEPPWWDTQPAGKVLFDHEDSYSLKALHAKYVSKDEAITFADLFGDDENSVTIYDKPIDLAGIYAAGDARKTYELTQFQRKYIDTVDNLRTVWYEIEQKLLHVDAITERHGLNVDLPWLESLKDEFEPKLAEAERKVREAFGLDETFNFDSHHDIARLVYDIAGADPKFPVKKFRKPERSTDKAVIDALCEDMPNLKPLLEYRMLAKLLGTYVEKIPAAIEPATGRMHFQLNADGTDTGRYSSEKYVSGKKSATGDHAKGMNIQNVPSRTEEGKRVRMAFVPSPGYLFVSSDLSQIEPRQLAHILYVKFDDDSLKRIYDRGEDIYVQKAMDVFELPLENCVDGAYDPTHTFKPRALMKEGVLAYMYGQSPYAFARRMGVSKDIAERFFTSMERSIPGLARFRAWVFETLEHRGNMAYSETMWGRKRRYPEYRKDLAALRKIEHECFDRGEWALKKGIAKPRDDDEAERQERMLEALRTGTLTDEDRNEIIRLGINFRKKDEREKIRERYYDLRGKVNAVRRQAVNHIIQGSAADTLKLIVIRLFWAWRVRDWRFLFSAHDEVFTEVPARDVTPETIEMLNEIMTKTVELSVPLKCDTVVSPRWMEEYKPDAWFARSDKEAA